MHTDAFTVRKKEYGRKGGEGGGGGGSVSIDVPAHVNLLIKFCKFMYWN